MDCASTRSADQTRYHHERRVRSLSPLSHPEPSAAPRSTSRFMPPKSGAAGLSPLQLETQELDVESPSATLRFKEPGQGIIYHPPENLAEFLDCMLVTPVSGGGGAGISQRTLCDERDELSISNSDPTRSRVCQTNAWAHEEVNFYCAFCMRDRPGANRRRFEGNGGCSHLFCKECLEDYLFQRIRVGHHSFHPCPKVGEEGCRSAATTEDVRRIVRQELYEEHRRRLEGLAGPCETCGIRGCRQSDPSTPPRVTGVADSRCSSCGSNQSRRMRGALYDSFSTSAGGSASHSRGHRAAGGGLTSKRELSRLPSTAKERTWAEVMKEESNCGCLGGLLRANRWPCFWQERTSSPVPPPRRQQYRG